MSAIYRAVLLMLVSVSLYAGTENRSLALYAGEASGLDASAIRSAQRELDRLLTPTGIDLVWKNLSTRNSSEEFHRIVVVSFDGSCSPTDASMAFGKLQGSDLTLADSSVSNGDVLPFFRVDCAHLAQLLAPSLRPMSSKDRSAAFGRALGRVMAHEIYHIIGETTAHQTTGVAKAALSVQDLLGTRLDFDIASLTQMRPTLPTVSVARSYGREATRRDTEKVREP